MERLPRGVYSPELREQAVRLFEDEQLTIPEFVVVNFFRTHN